MLIYLFIFGERHYQLQHIFLTELKPNQSYSHFVNIGQVSNQMFNISEYGDVKAHVFISKPLTDKLRSKTWECRFIGYVNNCSNYRFYHCEKGLIESRDFVFLENTN
jgi:hypothetical protein